MQSINPLASCGCNSLRGTELIRPATFSSCQQVIEMFKDWEKAYGLEKARRDFVTWWVGLPTLNTARFTCLYDSAFTGFFESKGIDLSTWDAKLIQLPTRVISSAADLVTNTVDDVVTIVDNATDTVGNATKTAKWVVPVAIIGSLAIGGVVLHTCLTAPLKALPIKT